MLLRFYDASNNILLLIPQVILFIFFGELLPTYTSIFIMIISTLCRNINLETSNNQAKPPATSHQQPPTEPMAFNHEMQPKHNMNEHVRVSRERERERENK